MQPDLDRLLSLYPSEVRPLGPISCLGNAGGASGALLYRFRARVGECVLRGWPTGGVDPGRVDSIHRSIDRLSDLPFIPVPLANRDGRTFVVRLGRVWDVSPWMPGSPDTSRPVDPARLASAFATLGDVHLRLRYYPLSMGSPGLQMRLNEVEGLIDGELSRFEAILSRASDEAPAALARRWLAMARPVLATIVPRLRRETTKTFLIGPVLRDVRRDHFLFVGDELTGLVDFGAVGYDVPAADLARLLGEWVGRDRRLRAIALDAYHARRELPDAEAALIDVFEEANAWLGPARWVRWHFVEGRHFDDPDAVENGLRRCLERLADRLA